MARHIRLYLCLIFVALFVVSLFAPAPVHAIGGGYRWGPRAMLYLYSRILANYRLLDAQEKLRVVLHSGFFLMVHLTIVALVTFLINERLKAWSRRRKRRQKVDEVQ